MRRSTAIFAALLALATVVVVRSKRLPATKAPSGQATALKALRVAEPAPVCPWRDPQRDLRILFPDASTHGVEKRILSDSMVAIQKRLGRPMMPSENPLHIYRATRSGGVIGSVLVSRVKGEHGGIEIVTAVDNDGFVKGVLVQSQREPQAVADVIVSPEFLSALTGRNFNSELRIGEDLPGLPAAARASAQSIADGVRSQLILLSFAEMRPNPHSSAVHKDH